jgi:hypothetical protein
LVTAVCPPTTQIESTVRPIANVHPPTVLGEQWPGDTGTYDPQGTRSVDFDEKRRLLLELSFLTGHPLREIDRDGATKCPTGTPTLEKAVACLEPCLSFYASVLAAGFASIARILTVVSAVISPGCIEFCRNGARTRGIGASPVCNVEIVQCDQTWTSNET